MKVIPKGYTFYKSVQTESFEDVININNLTTDSLTTKLQRYIDAHQIITLPDGELTVNKNGIILRSNKTLIFQKNTVLKIQANDLEKYSVIQVKNATNVKIINAHIIGDRDLHFGTKGEWGHGINIVGSENVVVDNFKIENCWGDGIYVGRIDSNISKNITIKNGVLNNNRRNGLSVTSVDRLVLQNVTAANSNGTNPQFGIDFETNDGRDEMNNVNAKNIITFNNANGGLMFSVNKMGGEGKWAKDVNFILDGYQDFYSGKRGLFIARISGFKKLTGGLILRNIILNNNVKPFEVKTIKEPTFKVQIKNFEVKNPLNKNVTKQELNRVFKLNPNIILLDEYK